MKLGYSVFLLGFVLTLFLFSSINAENVKNGKLKKASGYPSTTKLSINKISTYFSNDGQSDLNPLGNSGFEYPKGSGKQTFFQTGFVWGGRVNGQVRVGGVTYQSGLLPGKILSPTQAENPDAPNVRIYRVRPDWKTGSMNAEVRDGQGSEAEVRAQYEADWNEWPAAADAPFTDVDGNGVYDPTVDIPGVPGAGQTIWYVANDLDADQCSSLYGSTPIGIELQTTVWGYSSAGALDNMLFRKYKIINKSQFPVTEMYVSNWSDPDLGNATDDLAGCDTTLNLIYCYNGNPIDNVYLDNPPAVGFQLLQGPIITGVSTDKAFFGGRWVTGKKNLPMTSFYYFINGDTVMADPHLGVDYNKGTLRFWNLLQGKISTTGKFFPVPTSLGGGVTKFPLSGDPVAGTGYLDGLIFPNGDRRIGSVSGPFILAVGDTQEIVVAQIATNEANSISGNIVQLKKITASLPRQYTDGIFVGVEKGYNIMPLDYSVLQNYPNPFNPTTTIKYNLPVTCNIAINIYNSMGQLIEELINKTQSPDKYEIKWNAKEFASGIYFYSIRASSLDGKQNYSAVRKMVLLK